MKQERLVNNRYRYHCKCGYKCSAKNLLGKHLKSKNNGNLFKCDACSKSFPMHKGLKAHLKRVHSREIPELFACHDCGETFSNMQDHRMHRKHNHSNLRLTPKVGPEPEPDQPKITHFFRQLQ